MQRLLFLVFSQFLCQAIFSQSESPNNKTIGEKFDQLYNHENYDSIYYLFSPEMKKVLSLENTRQYFTSLRIQAGNLTKRTFKKYKETFAIYTGDFEKTTFDIWISVDDHLLINGFQITPPEKKQVVARNKTILQLPFKGAWTVFWGGDTKEQNYHVQNSAQKNAFDFVITGQNKKTYKTDGKKNEDYYAFGQPILAPCDGEIVLVVDGVKDNVPGSMNAFHAGGNTVIIKTATNDYLYLCHFKQHSILVKQGQHLKHQQALGLCGNSGNSSEPHLHLHIQNIENSADAIGIKCFFDKLIVNGQPQSDYSPVKDDLIKNQ
jgi:hypothetical protein